MLVVPIESNAPIDGTGGGRDWAVSDEETSMGPIDGTGWRNDVCISVEGTGDSGLRATCGSSIDGCVVTAAWRMVVGVATPGV